MVMMDSMYTYSYQRYEVSISREDFNMIVDGMNFYCSRISH
jgi:hypothetical protein